jgi:hypothetical protein
VHAVIGIPLTLLLAAAVMWGTSAARTELWWIASTTIAALVSLDAFLERLRRYPSRFPLQPVGAFIATVMMWPAALPWFLHIKWRIRTGRLREDSPPKDPGCAYALATLAGIAVVWGTVRAIQERPMLRDLQAVAQAVRVASPAAFRVSLSNGSNLKIVVDSIPTITEESLKVVANRIATIAYFSFRDSTRLNSIDVWFRSVKKNGLVTVTTWGPGWEWWPEHLDPSRSRHRAVAPN